MKYRVDEDTRDKIVESFKQFRATLDKLEYPTLIINNDELFPKNEDNDESKIVDYNNYVKKLTKNKK